MGPVKGQTHQGHEIDDSDQSWHARRKRDANVRVYARKTNNLNGKRNDARCLRRHGRRAQDALGSSKSVLKVSMNLRIAGVSTRPLR